MCSPTDIRGSGAEQLNLPAEDDGSHDTPVRSVGVLSMRRMNRNVAIAASSSTVCSQATRSVPPIIIGTSVARPCCATHGKSASKKSAWRCCDILADYIDGTFALIIAVSATDPIGSARMKYGRGAKPPRGSNATVRSSLDFHS